MRDNLVRVFEDKRYFYDGHGRLIRKLAGRHTEQQFRWDEENHLIEVITTRRPGTEHQATQTTRFDYDAIGRRVAKHDSFGTTTFIWEGMRLIEERRGGNTISYVYEPGSYVPLARLDADGEKTDQGGLGTVDDAQPPDAINSVAFSASQTGATGSNPSKTAADDAESRYWASLNETARQKAQVLQIQDWGTGTERVTASADQAQLCKVYYFHTDQVGMPQELTNAQGQVIWQACYKTWGSTVAEEWEVKTLAGNPVHKLDEGDSPAKADQQQNLRFQGQYLDRDTGLHYNTFRYYDPDVGRFICPDPIGLAGGINLGSYSPNPLMWIDPWGWSCSWDSNASRWRNNETGRFEKRPTNPADLMNNGRLNKADVDEWGRQGGMPNVWGSDPNRFPSGGFKYENGDYRVHGHGIDPQAASRHPGSNSASGPTAGVRDKNNNQVLREDGTWGPFGQNPNGAHIPLDNSGY